MSRHRASCLVGLLLGVLFPVCALGKPMPAPTKEEALASPHIVIAEYVGYASEGLRQPGYFHGPIAQYRTVEVLKGGTAPTTLNVRYDFHDGSACIAPKDWVFSERLMPAVGSKWILFLRTSGGGNGFTTYRGDFGRWAATEEKIAEVKKALQKAEER